ncbi:4-hydroxybenzoate polyprenyltransferase, mitochondrial-like [Lolium rigidum]|uniref:4-hydroxybenzoate polyprenyltransferase, mitochondrial-like n=1 Tax=Lolium rigidum TaxID=89674 RepID=UPI001F5D2874|nr:4-hydroxybenzoate polyprenyltransferase, mitochondrial-like [Lolium rigidum]XP_047074764.1 4-hydroxybenzoate polyprenyltransferase, mitochondrial-like [Lolium rigidum]
MPRELPDLKMLALSGCGAVLLRGAGCTVNDILDRGIDNKVERTKSRQFASGALTPSQGVCSLDLSYCWDWAFFSSSTTLGRKQSSNMRMVVKVLYYEVFAL